MEKMNFFQTCLNNRLLEANLPCIASPAGCAAHVVLLGLGHILGCAGAKPPLGNTRPESPRGWSTGWPLKEMTTEGAEESVHIHKGPTWGRGLGLVCKAFTKTPAIICLILASWGVVPRLLWAEYLCLQAAHAGAKKQNHQVTACSPSCPGTKLIAQENYIRVLKLL